MAADPTSPQPAGADRIVAERQRQLDEEGWDAEHDKIHSNGDLVRAALAYAAEALPEHAGERIVELAKINRTGYDRRVLELRDLWPWDFDEDKRRRHGQVRCLEIAGALIAAEIDRMLRDGGE